MEGTIFTPCLEAIPHVKSADGDMQTKPFLDACKLLLPVIDKFGAAMALVKSDVGGNISRLDTKYEQDPSANRLIYDIVRKEIEEKTAKGSSSCTNALLWLTSLAFHATIDHTTVAVVNGNHSPFTGQSCEDLIPWSSWNNHPEKKENPENWIGNSLKNFFCKRAMDFLVELFRNLLEHPDWTMTQACTDSYAKTLKKWHGWIASTSFNVAMKLAPERKKFMEVIGGTGDITSDMEKFCASFPELLQENHKFLQSVGLDNLKAS